MSAVTNTPDPNAGNTGAVVVPVNVVSPITLYTMMQAIYQATESLNEAQVSYQIAQNQTDANQNSASSHYAQAVQTATQDYIAKVQKLLKEQKDAGIFGGIAQAFSIIGSCLGLMVSVATGNVALAFVSATMLALALTPPQDNPLLLLGQAMAKGSTGTYLGMAMQIVLSVVLIGLTAGAAAPEVAGQEASETLATQITNALKSALTTIKNALPQMATSVMAVYAMEVGGYITDIASIGLNAAASGYEIEQAGVETNMASLQKLQTILVGFSKLLQEAQTQSSKTGQAQLQMFQQAQQTLTDIVTQIGQALGSFSPNG